MMGHRAPQCSPFGVVANKVVITLENQAEAVGLIVAPDGRVVAVSDDDQSTVIIEAEGEAAVQGDQRHALVHR